MKKWFYVVFIVLGLGCTANYFYSSFTLVDRVTLSSETISTDENYYLGYGLKWRGLLSPKLVDVSLRNKDGSLIDKSSEEVEMVPFIDGGQHTGTYDEASYQEALAEGVIDYVPITQADVRESTRLVLRINIRDKEYNSSVAAMILSYKIFGIPKEQSIEFDGFLHDN